VRNECLDFEARVLPNSGLGVFLAGKLAAAIRRYNLLAFGGDDIIRPLE
jgi:hypothetical protein